MNLLQRLFLKRTNYKLLKRINDLVPYKLSHYANINFAQEGEDIILERILNVINNNKYKTGFYVDCGAHHPIRFSNTYLLYKKGWRGINIDPLPNIKELFDKERPEDINLEIGVGTSKDTATYYMFNEPALNSFNKNTIDELKDNIHYHLVEEKLIKIDTLESILDQYLPKGKTIDLMSIDCENMDFDVIKSNNWSKYTPNILIIEDQKVDFKNLNKSQIYNFLVEKDYVMFSKLFYSTIFIKKDLIKLFNKS